MRDWLLQATQLPEIVLTPTGSVRPQTDYGALTLIWSEMIDAIYGDARTLSADDDPAFAEINAHLNNEKYEGAPNQTYTIHSRSWTWQFDIFHRDAMDIGSRIEVWHTLQEAQMHVAPLVIHNVGAVRQMPEYKHNKWHNRAVVDITMHGKVVSVFGDGDYIAGVPSDVLDPATIDIYEVVTGRDLQDGLTDKPLRPESLAAKLS